MSFESTYQLVAPISDTADVLCYKAIQKLTGEEVWIHIVRTTGTDILECAQQANAVPGFAEKPVLEVIREGAKAYIVTRPLPPGESLRDWLASLSQVKTPDSLQMTGAFRPQRPGDMPAGLPAMHMPAFAPPQQPRQPPLPPPPAPFSPPAPNPVAQPPSALPAPPTNSPEPGEFAQMFPTPSSLAPPPMIPPPAALMSNPAPNAMPPLPDPSSTPPSVAAPSFTPPHGPSLTPPSVSLPPIHPSASGSKLSPETFAGPLTANSGSVQPGLLSSEKSATKFFRTPGSTPSGIPGPMPTPASGPGEFTRMMEAPPPASVPSIGVPQPQAQDPAAPPPPVSPKPAPPKARPAPAVGKISLWFVFGNVVIVLMIILLIVVIMKSSR
ncbi:MAG: hypothetical protein ACK5TN_15160 [Acidobacteriota bacterium]